MSQDEQTIRTAIVAWSEQVRVAYPKIARHEPGASTPPHGTLTEPILRGLVVGILRDITMSGVGRRSVEDAAAFVRDGSVCAIDFTNGRVVLDVPKIVRWFASEA